MVVAEQAQNLTRAQSCIQAAGTRAQALATSKAASRCKSTRAAPLRTSGARAVPRRRHCRKLRRARERKRRESADESADESRHAQQVHGRGQRGARASTWLTTRALPNDLGEMHIVSSGLLESDTPGNGGLRVWNYADKAAATKEAEGLAVAMSAKHKTYNTGFAGAKVVCAADKPSPTGPRPTARPSSRRRRPCSRSSTAPCTRAAT